MSARNLADGAVAAVPAHKRNRWRDNHDRFVGFLLLMPLVVLILGLTVYPIAQVMQLSTQQQGLFSTESTFVGLQNFQNVVQHEAFGRSVKNTFTFAFGSLALQMAIGLAVALLLNRQFPLRTPIRGAMLFSYLVPYVVAAMTWKFMFSDATGILNYFIRWSGLPMAASPFGSLDWSMFGVILVNTWKNFPFMVLVFLAQLQTIDQELYEAASVDGATSFQQFWNITLPSLIPIMLVVGMLRTIWNFNNFEVVFLLTQGGPLGRTETLPLLIYRFVFGEFSLGRGAALAVIVFCILVSMSIIYWYFYERMQEKFK